jgi:addiction module HigA family antidote
MLHQDRAATPGARLRAEIDRLGLDQVAVAQSLGVSRQTVNNIVNDRQPISRSMAGKLGRLTGRSSDYWLRSQFPAAEASQSTPAEEPAVPYAAAENRGGGGVAILVNHQIVRAYREGIINIDPFIERNVQPTSIKLTLDDFIFTIGGQRGDGNPTDISGGQSFTLLRGQSVSVRTGEWIELPLDYVGRVGAVAKLAACGILVSHGGEVEPGFKGHLQFCLFNAGIANFELRGGDPIVGLQIMPLSSLPAVANAAGAASDGVEDDDRIAGHFSEPGDAGPFDRLVREQIRGQVKVDGVAPRITARIPDLDIKLVVTSKEEAYAAAVTNTLTTLALLQANRDLRTDLNNKYETFFNEVADRICLSGEQARNAIGALGLSFQDAKQSIVKVRADQIAMLQLPPLSAKITLRSLANQLHMNTNDVVLTLTGGRTD